MLVVVLVNASNHLGLAQIIHSFACKDILELEKMGNLGKQYSDKYFDFHNCMDNLERILGS